MDLQGIECRSMDWNDLARDISRWRELVNAGTNFRVPKYGGNFLIT